MTDVTEELYSLLVPIAETRLIVPRVCVAEVTGLGQLQIAEMRGLAVRLHNDRACLFVHDRLRRTGIRMTGK